MRRLLNFFSMLGDYIAYHRLTLKGLIKRFVGCDFEQILRSLCQEVNFCATLVVIPDYIFAKQLLISTLSGQYFVLRLSDTVYFLARKDCNLIKHTYENGLAAVFSAISSNVHYHASSLLQDVIRCEIRSLPQSAIKDALIRFSKHDVATLRSSLLLLKSYSRSGEICYGKSRDFSLIVIYQRSFAAFRTARWLGKFTQAILLSTISRTAFKYDVGSKADDFTLRLRKIYYQL